MARKRKIAQKAAREASLAAFANPQFSPMQAFAIARAQARAAGISDEDMDAMDEPEKNYTEDELQALEEKEANGEDLTEDEQTALDEHREANDGGEPKEFTQDELEALEEKEANGEDLTEDEQTALDEHRESKSQNDDDMPAARTSQAILNLPEARGRDALAREVAFTPGMTTARAKRILSKSPKVQTRTPTDPNLSAGGPSSAASDDRQKIEASAARAVALIQ